MVSLKEGLRQIRELLKDFQYNMLQPIPEDQPKVDPDPNNFNFSDIKESSGFKALQAWQQEKIVSDLEIIKKQTDLSLFESLKMYQQWGYDASEAIIHHLHPTTTQLDRSIRCVTSDLTESEKKIRELREIVDAKNLLFDALKKQGQSI